MSPAPSAPEESLEGHYAGVASRAAACVIDAALSLAIFTGTVAATSYVIDLVFDTQWDDDSSLLWGLGLGLWLFFYYWYCWGMAGKTPGAALLGIRVVRQDGHDLGFRRALIRTFVYPLSFAFFGIGLWGALLRSPTPHLAGPRGGQHRRLRLGRPRRASALPRAPPRLNALRHPSRDAAEAEVAGRALGFVGAARADPVPAAIGSVAEVGAAAHDPARAVLGTLSDRPRASSGSSRGRTSRHTIPTRCRSCCAGRNRSAGTHRPARSRGSRRPASSRSGTCPATRSCGARRRARDRCPKERAFVRAHHAPRTPIRPRSAAACRTSRRTRSRRSTTRARPGGRHGRRSTTADLPGASSSRRTPVATRASARPRASPRSRRAANPRRRTTIRSARRRSRDQWRRRTHANSAFVTAVVSIQNGDSRTRCTGPSPSPSYAHGPSVPMKDSPPSRSNHSSWVVHSLFVQWSSSHG